MDPKYTDLAEKTLATWRQDSTSAHSVHSSIVGHIAETIKASVNDTWEAAAKAVEEGRFLTEDSPAAQFAREVAAMLRRKKT